MKDLPLILLIKRKSLIRKNRVFSTVHMSATNIQCMQIIWHSVNGGVPSPTVLPFPVLFFA